MVVLRHDTFSLAYTINPLSELSKVLRGSSGLITKSLPVKQIRGYKMFH